jgi:hypothetical protein
MLGLSDFARDLVVLRSCCLSDPKTLGTYSFPLSDDVECQWSEDCLDPERAARPS